MPASPYNQPLVGHMPTPEEYKRFAELCTEAAKTTDDEVERMMLPRVADQWRRLAVYKATKVRKAPETQTSSAIPSGPSEPPGTGEEVSAG